MDGGKPLFKVLTRMVSSIYTTDTHLHNFFESCQRFYSAATTSDQDVVKYLKVSGCLIAFLSVQSLVY